MTPDTVRLRRRSRILLILTVFSLVLTALAAAVPMWIEEFTSLEPDGGNGELELILPIPFTIATLVLGALTYRARRRLRIGYEPGG
jgi:hypothetical protein